MRPVCKVLRSGVVSVHIRLKGITARVLQLSHFQLFFDLINHLILLGNLPEHLLLLSLPDVLLIGVVWGIVQRIFTAKFWRLLRAIVALGINGRAGLVLLFLFFNIALNLQRVKFFVAGTYGVDYLLLFVTLLVNWIRTTHLRWLKHIELMVLLIVLNSALACLALWHHTDFITHRYRFLARITTIIMLTTWESTLDSLSHRWLPTLILGFFLVHLIILFQFMPVNLAWLWHAITHDSAWLPGTNWCDWGHAADTSIEYRITATIINHLALSDIHFTIFVDLVSTTFHLTACTMAFGSDWHILEQSCLRILYFQASGALLRK